MFNFHISKYIIGVVVFISLAFSNEIAISSADAHNLEFLENHYPEFFENYESELDGKDSSADAIEEVASEKASVVITTSGRTSTYEFGYAGEEQVFEENRWVEVYQRTI